jgi:hypothetical protein
MKKVLAVLPLMLASVVGAVAQTANTTYTVTADSCGGKALQYCTLPVGASPNDGTPQLVIDNTVYGGSLYFSQFNVLDRIQGTYSGFVGNPDGTRNPFYGIASFESSDGRVVGTFNFYAYYVSTCSGRGCGGELGWHYRILQNSTVKVN